MEIFCPRAFMARMSATVGRLFFRTMVALCQTVKALRKAASASSAAPEAKASMQTGPR